MTMRALVSSDLPVVRIWHPDKSKLYVEISSKRKRQPTPPSSN